MEDKGMKNEYGVELDRNGYAPSLMQRDQRCYICGHDGHNHRHEVFGGGLRQKSKRLGMWCHLCPTCHQNGRKAAHKDSATANWLKRKAQQAAMDRYRWSAEDFINQFGKNYL
jgi:hypothetical protein